jgi:hypothetical protein
VLLPARQPFPARGYSTYRGGRHEGNNLVLVQVSSGTACATNPANHPAAIAKTGVKMATSLPIIDLSVAVTRGLGG